MQRRQPFETRYWDIKVVALAGGVGGARLAAGLQAVLKPGALTVIVNTGDDFEHWGLTICPDLDTVMYNLAGVHNPDTGWGRADETFAVLDEMRRQGGPDWFRIGDRDLVTHLRRTEWLRQGLSLTEVTDRLRRDLGVPSIILPMSDDPVRTLVHTDEGDLPFQHYFVRRRCEPKVVGLSFVGADRARPTPQVLEAIDRADVVILCPSNPYLSLDPILSLLGLRAHLRQSRAPRLAVSPIVGGQALKGPAAKMMRELGEEVSPLTVAHHFADLLDGFVMDQADAALARMLTIPTLVTDTVMADLDAKARLACEVLDFAQKVIRLQPT
ncbi:MAG: 2-phospho-L-lactate transferase [Anaerolineae bacterium]|nr:2-phospho-L-lactate transferase [Anaerolineae bacterium]MDW8099059.1 2-phospho-L-lactate transferase [Anaerolineae bacterium]